MRRRMPTLCALTIAELVISLRLCANHSDASPHQQIVVSLCFRDATYDKTAFDNRAIYPTNDTLRVFRPGLNPTTAVFAVIVPRFTAGTSLF